MSFAIRASFLICFAHYCFKLAPECLYTGKFVSNLDDSLEAPVEGINLRQDTFETLDLSLTCLKQTSEDDIHRQSLPLTLRAAVQTLWAGARHHHSVALDLRPWLQVEP